MQVHDIEDLAKLAKMRKACPYFTARHIAENAELLFCPYNYIIDPIIRSSVGIDLKGAVVIFDEVLLFSLWIPPCKDLLRVSSYLHLE
jgi:fanconi anemia group J protein